MLSFTIEFDFLGCDAQGVPSCSSSIVSISIINSFVRVEFGCEDLWKDAIVSVFEGLFSRMAFR